MTSAERSAFFQNLDPTVCESAVRDAIAGKRHWPRLGEGRHFTVWRVAIPESHLDWAVRLAKPEFMAERGGSCVAWRTAINRLGQNDWPLIPPMRAWQADKGMCLMVMPHYPQAIPSEAWRLDGLLRGALAETMRHLGHLGLALSDAPQGRRSLDGVPFLVDWSELNLRQR